MNSPSAIRTPWLRWHIVKTLLHKEVLRHLANRGGIALVLLLVVASLLLSLTGGEESQPGAGGFGGVKRCYIDYWERDAWVEHLMDNVPKELEATIRIRNVRKAPTNPDGTIIYAQNTGGIQVRPNPAG